MFNPHPWLQKTYKFTGGGVSMDPKNKAVLFKRYASWFSDSVNNQPITDLGLYSLNSDG